MALQFIHVPVVIKSMNFIHLTENCLYKILTSVCGYNSDIKTISLSNDSYQCMHSDMASLCHLVNTWKNAVVMHITIPWVDEIANDQFF